MTRDERQAICEQRFVDAKGIGTLECTPAFGKTRIATNILARMKAKRPDLKTIIIVPREYLQRQWSEIIKEKGLEKNTEVVIVNTAVKGTYMVDFLICDEIHRLAAPTFQQIFDRVKFKWILGLTGTIKRLDQKHTILTTHCPIVDRVTAAEARKEGWVAEYLEFNLGIELPAEELAKYQRYEDDYDTYAKKFMYEFKLMQNCALSYKPKLAHVPGMGLVYTDSSCSQLAKQYGWTGNSPSQAHLRVLAKEADIWEGTKGHPFHPKNLYIWAINGLRAIRKIKTFVQNHPAKLSVAVDLCQKIPVKTITFGESIKGADLLTSALLPDAVSYHSRTPRLPGMTRKKTLEQITSDIKTGKYRIVNTARALDEGADFPEMQMGIRVAGSSSPTQHTQRRG